MARCRRLWLLAATLTGAAVGLGCNGEPTEILVIVSSDLPVPAELDAIEVRVVPPGGAAPQISVANLGPGETPLPRTLGLVHESGPLGPFNVTVTGTRGGNPVVDRIGELTFIPGEIRVWRVNLSRSCVGQGCPEGETCDAGRCRPTVVTPGELEAYVPGPDAGDPRDDAGPGECVPTGAETCDGRDNDCDDTVDEGFDLMDDLAHCGRCDNACEFQNGAGSCTGGACVVSACDAGFDDCNNDGVDGCEADLASAAHCGRCGNACAFANAGATCTGGACAMGACDTGFEDCDMSEVNGCEVDIRTVAACGSCTNMCVAANGTPGCVGGATCGIASCSQPFADCNTAYADGCEANTDSDAANCGDCGTACTGGETCQDGDCCLPGCPNCDVTCMSATPCVCTPGCGCTLDCDSASFCDPRCDGAGTMCDVDLRTVSNGGGRCTMGASCVVDARESSNLDYTCDGAGTSCDVDCTDSSNCSVQCTGGAACRIDCQRGSNCSIDTCPTGVMTCGGGNIRVCNRAC